MMSGCGQPGTSAQLLSQASTVSQGDHHGAAGLPAVVSSLEAPGAPVWASDPIWQAQMRHLGSLPFSPSVLELCAGAGTASLALNLLLGQDKVRLAGAWDTDVACRAIHEVIHGAGHPGFHFGQPAGDIMATSLDKFPDSNILVAGPPCPPFSSSGKRRALEDPRAAPFQRCVDVLAELDSRSHCAAGSDSASRDELMFFLLENVMGISHTPSDESGGEAPLHTLVLELQSRLGAAWQVQYVQANALDFGLPQSRPRIYIVGRKAKFYTQHIPGGPARFRNQVRPGQLLDKENNQAPHLTALQSQCLEAWKQKHSAAMDNPAFLGQVAIVEAGRDPSGRTAWSRRTGTNPLPVDRCQCLRASGPKLHVFSLGEGSQALSLDRLITVRERAALQGFPDSIGQLPLTETVGCRVFGNAMSVPVVGSMMAIELAAILASWRAAAAAAQPCPQAQPHTAPLVGRSAAPVPDISDQLTPGSVAGGPPGSGDDAGIMTAQNVAVGTRASSSTSRSPAVPVARPSKVRTPPPQPRHSTPVLPSCEKVRDGAATHVQPGGPSSVGSQANESVSEPIMSSFGALSDEEAALV